MTTINKNAEKIIREEFGFKTMKIDITEEEVNKQKENYESKIEFTKALRLCLESFLNDGSKFESPLALVKEFYPIENPEKKLREKMDKGAIILMGEKETNYPLPVNGEKTKENWIFGLAIEISDYTFWAIAERSGQKPVYNYGYN